MKLSTVMIAGAALAGATAIASAASAATVFEQYLYSGGGSSDNQAFTVKNDSGAAYTDVTIGGQDFGSLAAGATTTFHVLGDPEAGGNFSALVTINTGTKVYSETFTANLGDIDHAVGPTFVGEIAVPEPASWALLLAGFAGLGGALRLSRRKFAVAA